MYYFVLIGFSFSDYRCLIIKAKIEPLSPVIDEICHGLSCYGLMDVIKQNVEVFRPVFTKIGTFTWHYDIFVRSLKPKFSEEGGNRKTQEVTTYRALLDIMEYCFNDGVCIWLYLHWNAFMKHLFLHLSIPIESLCKVFKEKSLNYP